MAHWGRHVHIATLGEPVRTNMQVHALFVEEYSARTHTADTYMYTHVCRGRVRAYVKVGSPVGVRHRRQLGRLVYSFTCLLNLLSEKVPVCRSLPVSPVVGSWAQAVETTEDEAPRDTYAHPHPVHTSPVDVHNDSHTVRIPTSSAQLLLVPTISSVSSPTDTGSAHDPCPIPHSRTPHRCTMVSRGTGTDRPG